MYGSSPKRPLVGHLDAGGVRGIEDLLRAAAARIRTQLVNRIGADIAVRSASTDWLPLAEALARISEGSAWATFRLERAGLTGVVSISHGLLSRLVGQILGQPVDDFTLATPRALSRFDLVIAKRIGQDVASAIAQLFPDHLGETAVMGEVGASSRVAIGLPRTSHIGSTLYEVGPVDDPIGTLTVILPAEITRALTPRPQRRDPESRVGMDRVMVLPVVAVAELGRIKLSLAELRALKAGRMLDLGPARDVVVRVGDKPALIGEAGVQNHFRSVRLKGRVSGVLGHTTR